MLIFITWIMIIIYMDAENVQRQKSKKIMTKLP